MANRPERVFFRLNATLQGVAFTMTNRRKYERLCYNILCIAIERGEEAMEREKLQRSDLKKNFLKEIIMRLDFQGVLQAEMERILMEVKPYLKGKSFNRYEEKIIDDGNSITDMKSQISYAFMSDVMGYTIGLSVSSIILTIRTQGYSSFDEYAELFAFIAKVYKSKIDFFTVKRFGLRKINFCFSDNREVITKYFNNAYFNCESPATGFESQTTERIDRLSNGIHNINMRYAIEQGQLENDLVYKVTLDSDIYVTDQSEIERLLFKEESINEVNETLFRIYLNAITEDFIKVLCSDEDSVDIIGVESNE